MLLDGAPSELDNRELGAFFRLFLTAWRRDGLPENIKELRAISRDSRAVTQRLLDQFFTLTHGRYRNAEQEMERARYEEIRRKRAEAGKLGGQANATANAQYLTEANAQAGK
jgi:uncharacterized protein YdaU (DUF1376 family)